MYKGSISLSATNLRKHLLGFSGFLVLLLFLLLITGCQVNAPGTGGQNPITEPSSRTCDGSIEPSSRTSDGSFAKNLRFFNGVNPKCPFLGKSLPENSGFKEFAETFATEVEKPPNTKLALTSYSRARDKVTEFTLEAAPNTPYIAKGTIKYKDDAESELSTSFYFSDGWLCPVPHTIECTFQKKVGAVEYFPLGIAAYLEDLDIYLSSGAKVTFDTTPNSPLYTGSVSFQRTKIRSVGHTGPAMTTYTKSYDEFDLQFVTKDYNAQEKTLDLTINKWYIDNKLNSGNFKQYEKEPLTFNINPDEPFALHVESKYQEQSMLTSGTIVGQFYGNETRVYASGIFAFYGYGIDNGPPWPALLEYRGVFVSEGK